MTGGNALAALKRERPEWAPWLAVVEEILSETTTPQWDAIVPDPPEVRRAEAPLLSGQVLNVEAATVRAVLKRLLAAAARTRAARRW